MLLDQERFVRIRQRLDITSVVNARVLAFASLWPSPSAILKTPVTTRSENNPCNKLRITSRRENIDALGDLGGRRIVFDSSVSASKTIEQAGSIISSRKTICTGYRIIGQPSRTGISEEPAMGTWTLMI
jgi:hypothetical protein